MEIFKLKGKVHIDENHDYYLIDDNGNKYPAADLLHGIDINCEYITEIGDEIEIVVKRKI